MNESSELVVSVQPYTVRRTVRWTDCDPAGVAFAGRYPDYLLGAVMHFMRHIGYGAGMPQEPGPRVELPCKHMSLTFHASLYPDDVVDIRIAVAEIRKRTFDLLAHAYLPDGRLAFEGVFTPICIRGEVRESIGLPAHLRGVLLPYLLPGKGAAPAST